jgi:ATP-binding protein involved in chromosome partitioning
VASGKGGVGKSTTAVNLALALAAEGASVGILDADIYGPSQPHDAGHQPASPIRRRQDASSRWQAYGMQAMSIGFLIDQDHADGLARTDGRRRRWSSCCSHTNWRDLDYLIVDMPPGTGDIQLTLSQKVPVTAAVIVTTPQDIALLDARKGLKMFEKVGMPDPRHRREHEQSTSARSAATSSTSSAPAAASGWRRGLRWPYLGGLPLDIRIREQADCGQADRWSPSPTVSRGDLPGDRRKVAVAIAASPGTCP